MSQYFVRFLCALTCAVLLAGCNVEADFSDQLKTETLVAEQYQQEIAAIDRLVFAETPLGDEGVAALEKDLNDVAARITVGKPDSKFLKLESLELRHLANLAKRLSPSGTGARLQNDWMRIRNNLFDDRAWFARSAKDLEYAATVVPPPAAATATANPPESAPEPAPAEVPQATIADREPRKALTGKWQVVSMLANGEPRTDDELTGSIWTFDPPRLTLQAQGGKTTTYNATADGRYLDVSDPNGESGAMIYEFVDNGLRVGFFDGLKGKPSSFDPPPQKDPMLIVVRLVPVH